MPGDLLQAAVEHCSESQYFIPLTTLENSEGENRHLYNSRRRFGHGITQEHSILRGCSRKAGKVNVRSKPSIAKDLNSIQAILYSFKGFVLLMAWSN